MFDKDCILSTLNDTFSEYIGDVEVTGDTALVLYGLKKQCRLLKLHVTDDLFKHAASLNFENEEGARSITILLDKGNKAVIYPGLNKTKPCLFLDGIRLVEPETLVDYWSGYSRSPFGEERLSAKGLNQLLNYIKEGKGN